jgi:hypothetical protein
MVKCQGLVAESGGLRAAAVVEDAQGLIGCGAAQVDGQFLDEHAGSFARIEILQAIGLPGFHDLSQEKADEGAVIGW